MSDFFHEPAFRLDGYRPASALVMEMFHDRIAAHETEMSVLAQHHTSDGRQSFFILNDTSVIYGVPGEELLVALHITRDAASQTFTFDSEQLPLYALAQSWLLQHHCPASAVSLPRDTGTAPADEMTVALEERFRDHGNQYSILSSYSGEGYPTQETVVLLEASDRTVPQPFRILLESTDLRTFTHQLREGVFDTEEAALAWMDDRSTPLPTATATAIATVAMPHLPPAKPAGPTARPGRRR
ncbi:MULTISPECIES: hypothetical protein [unclassified Streptomyces]|uniref:hypothetical protein n=1 Tax=unclassified Streptomyces TaxID=2593676 RepID=UPI0037F258A6